MVSQIEKVTEQANENYQRLSHSTHSLCWGQAVLLCLLWLLWQDTETSKGQSFLLNYFWVRWNRGMNRIIKVRPDYRNACAALPSAERWKALRFLAPPRPFSPSELLTHREKIWHQSWQKHKGEKWTIPLWLSEHQSCSILLGKTQCSFVCVSEVRNNTCDWLNTVDPHYSKPEANHS